MNRCEHLLWVLAEECTEIAECASLAADHGMQAVLIGHQRSLAERLTGEFADLLGAMEMLEEDGHFKLPDLQEDIRKVCESAEPRACSRRLWEVVRACSLLGQRASKIARFGMDEVQPGQPRNNAERLIEAFAGLMGVMALMEREQHLVLPDLQPAITAKKAKVEKFLGYSAQCGTLSLAA